MRKEVRKIIRKTVAGAAFGLFAFAALLAAPGGKAEAADTSGTCGTTMTWDFSGTTLHIRGTGDMYNYSKGQAPWSSLKFVTVEFDPGILSVGDYAFADSIVSTVNLTDSIKRIGTSAFENCDRMVTIPLQGLSEIGERALYDCDSIASAAIAGSAEVGRSAFASCDRMTSVNIGGSATLWDEAFAGTTPQTLEIKDNTVVGKRAFSGCKQLNTLTIGNNCVIGEHAFAGTENLNRITLGQNLAVGNEVFDGAQKISSLTILSPTAPTYGSYLIASTRITSVQIYVPTDATGYDEEPWTMYHVNKTQEHVNPVAATYYVDETQIKSIKVGKGAILKDVTVDINPVASASGYEILYSYQQDFSDPTIARFGTGKTSITINVNRQKKLYLRVRAYKLRGGVEVYGGYGKQASLDDMDHYVTSVKLSKTSFKYNGKVQTPSVKVKLENGASLSAAFYNVQLPSGRKKVGTYKVKVTFKGDYAMNASKTLKYKIVKKK